MAEVREFFDQEGGKCRIDFFSFSPDKRYLFIALRFQSHDVARNVLDTFDGKRVLGHTMDIKWFKDLRKARARMFGDQQNDRHDDYDRDRDRRPPFRDNWNDRGNHRGRGAFRGGGDGGGWVHRGAYHGGRGGGGGGAAFPRRSGSFRDEFGRDRDNRSRSYDSAGSRSPRGAVRSRSGSRGRRATSPSRSASPEFARRARAFSRSGSPVPPAPMTLGTAFKAAELLDTSGSLDNGALSAASAERSAGVGRRAVDKKKKRKAKRRRKQPSADCSSSSSSGAQSAAEESSPARGGGGGGFAPADFSPVVQPPLRAPKRTALAPLSDRGAAVGAADDARRVNGRSHQQRDESFGRDPMQDTAKLTPNNVQRLKAKKEEIERAYKQDCETFATVVKMLINKDSRLEEQLQACLRETLRDIGQQCVEELRDFMRDLIDSQEQLELPA